MLESHGGVLRSLQVNPPGEDLLINTGTNKKWDKPGEKKL